VIGQKDDVVDGDVAYSINAVVDTLDIFYKSLSVTSISLSNTDTPIIKAETISGTNGMDIIDYATNLPSYILAEAADDDVSGEGGNDTIYGSYGNDVMSGNDGDDKLYGEQDNDYLEGNAGNDSLDGGLGLDTLVGGAGNDIYYLGYDAIDLIDDKGLNSDVDTIIMPFLLNSYTLPKGIENGMIDNGVGGNLTGNTGNNQLTGNDGNNSLNGSAGNDVLNGSCGKDTLIGGTGNDSFLFNSGLQNNVDKITDFSPKYDRIQLDDAVFKSLHTGALTASAFNSGGAVDSSDRLIYNKNTGALYFDDDGSGGHAAVQIATLGVKLAISAADFLVV
jgi:Ca2+-binding RTX toxin-like protein